ncbi:MAG: exosome complex RNA-binding protein Csl4 [Candidatus Bathyarchaeia archaeon]
MKEERRSGQFVTPGTRIAVIEEFLPGPGTYVENEGIYSKITGYILLDALNKRVSVYPAVKLPKVPNIGSIVFGIVDNVNPKDCDVNIKAIGRRSLTGSLSGVLHISDASPQYVESMFEVCRSGDYIKAEVVSNKNRIYHLSTLDRNLGVVLAFCSRCGNPLSNKRKNMYCCRCGNVEKRKVAAEYWGD